MAPYGLLTAQVNKSKFVPPNVSPYYIPRARLLGRLISPANKRYTLVHAPIGYGKTALLADWYHNYLHASGSDATQDTAKTPGDAPDNNEHAQFAIWYKVDTDDKEPAFFWRNMIEALESCFSGIGAYIKNNIQAFEHSSIRELIITMANYIVGCLEPNEQYFFILTNFDTFKFSESETEFFIMADMLPSNIHVVIASRVFLSNRLIRHNSSSEIQVIDVDELSLTRAELHDYINDQLNVSIHDDTLDKLYAKTEGWPLAVNVWIQDVVSGTPIDQATASLSGTNHLLHDFTFAPMTTDLPHKVMAFLIETSILGRFNAALCNRVTDSSDAQDVIDYLERNSIFTFVTDKDGNWYRYHPLFAQWLLGQSIKLRRDQLRVLNHRAGQWYRENGMYMLSIKHAIAAQESDMIARLAQVAYPALQPRTVNLLLWLYFMPEGSCRGTLYFCLLAAWTSVFSGRPQDALLWVDLAGDAFEINPSFPPQLRIGTSYVFPAQEGFALLSNGSASEWDATLERLELVSNIIQAKCYTLIGQNDLGISRSQEIIAANGYNLDASMQMVLSQNIGEALEQNGDLEAAMKQYQKAMTTARVNHFDFLTAFTRYQVINLLYQQGRYSRVEEMCRMALKDCPPDFTIYGALYSMLGLVAMDCGRTGEMETFFHRARGRVSVDRNIDIYLDVVFSHGYYLMDCKNYDEALLLLGSAIADIKANGEVPARGVAYKAFTLQCLVYMALGDMDSAMDVLQEYKSLGYTDSMQGRLELQITRSRLLLANGTPVAEVEPLLHEVIDDAGRCGFIRLELEAYVLLAVCTYRTEDRHQALSAIKKALEIARQEQIVKVFVREGEYMRLMIIDLLGQVHLGLDTERFVRKIIKAFECGISESAGPENERERLTRVMTRYGLTGRERDIIFCLQKGMNRKEIAVESHTSQNTVKTHIAHIYEKLGVHSVTELLLVLMEQ